MKALAISVRDLAEFVHRKGHIHRLAEETTSPLEGIRSQRTYQKRIQQERPKYDTEVLVQRSFDGADFTLKVSGRIDGLEPCDDGSVLVEEIKTTRLDPHTIADLGHSVNQAQLNLYAAMVGKVAQYDPIRVVLTYLHPDSLDKWSQTTEFEAAEVEEFFTSTCAAYTQWMRRVRKRVGLRNDQAKSQRFPYATYNEGQHRAAQHVYDSLKHRKHLLYAAATGTGKTLTTMFPSVKAMSSESIDRFVFISNRTTGQQAARQGLRMLHDTNSELTSISVTAKERICFTEGMPCDPEQCEYANGYYDRVRGARDVLLRRKQIDRAAVELVARNMKVCPYELTLDTAEWVDAVVCDYNYVFDPLVKLQRLTTSTFSRVGLLVDEAHALTARVVEMLSCGVSTALLYDVSKLLRDGDEPANVPVIALARYIESGAREVTFEAGEAEFNIDVEPVWSILDEFLEKSFNMRRDIADRDEFQQLSRAIYELRVAKDRYDAASYIWILKRTDADVELHLRCVSPGKWIREVLDGYQGSVRFSGSLTPATVFNETHGVDGPVHVAHIRSRADQFGIFIVPDVSTYYDDRESTSKTIASLVSVVATEVGGNWLVAFPSFAYLNLVAAHVDPECHVRRQERAWDMRDREAFLREFNELRNVIAFVTMGGVFTESIDLDAEALSGVFVIGPGIPPRSLERERLRTRGEFGFEVAYRQPAMTKVVQAAGRVVRHAEDRGVVVLVDPRFTRQEYAAYFPAHWTPKTVLSNNLSDEVQRFWVAADA